MQLEDGQWIPLPMILAGEVLSVILLVPEALFRSPSEH
jgi:hypothetical protein